MGSAQYVVRNTVAEAVGAVATGWATNVAGAIIVENWYRVRHTVVGARVTYSTTGAGAA